MSVVVTDPKISLSPCLSVATNIIVGILILDVFLVFRHAMVHVVVVVVVMVVSTSSASRLHLSGRSRGSNGLKHVLGKEFVDGEASDSVIAIHNSLQFFIADNGTLVSGVLKLVVFDVGPDGANNLKNGDHKV